MHPKLAEWGQAEGEIARVQEGFESGLYSLEEAKQRVGEYQAAITRAEGTQEATA